MNAAERDAVRRAVPLVVATLEAGRGVKLVSYRRDGRFSSMLALGLDDEREISMEHAVWRAFRHECGDRVTDALAAQVRSEVSSSTSDGGARRVPAPRSGAEGVVDLGVSRARGG